MLTGTAYEIFPEDGVKYRFQGTHALSLMGVDCPKCGCWSATGVEYPSVDPSNIEAIVPDCHIYGSASSVPMSIETFQTIREKLARVAGPDRPVKPGTRFGPLKATTAGTLPDFIWLHRWTLLVRGPVFRKIQDAGFAIIGVPVEMETRQKEKVEVIELEVPMAAAIHPSPPFRICELCGRNPTIRGREKVFDPSVPLQRICEWPTRIIITEAFSGFVVDQGYSGIDWKKIEAMICSRP